MLEKVLIELEENVKIGNYMKVEEIVGSNLQFITDPKFDYYLILSIANGGLTRLESIQLKQVFAQIDLINSAKNSVLDKVFSSKNAEEDARKHLYRLTNPYLLSALISLITNGTDEEISKGFEAVTPLYGPLKKYLSKRGTLDVKVFNAVGSILCNLSNTIIDSLEKAGKINMNATAAFVGKLYENIFEPLVKYSTGVIGFLMTLGGGQNSLNPKVKKQIKQEADKLKKLM